MLGTGGPFGAADANLPWWLMGSVSGTAIFCPAAMTAWTASCLNAYNTLCYAPGGFRTWWRRLHHGCEDQLDNAHLMRMAGRFARRVRASARAHGIPVIDCKRGERKHQIAEEYLATHTVGPGVFLIMVARAVAPVWEVTRSADSGVIGNLAKKRAFVNHYSCLLYTSDAADE